MLKPIIAMFVTVLCGWVFAALGHDLVNGFTELGTIVAVAVMGAFVIFFNEKKK
ncbi:hypothetical protein SDC9_162316 [bioreactor metagenome]|uniref:Binding-protein-dependent transport permease n=1 Tax=bioreactor metagenome TaxID=1076179 RepID=A0A645FKP8_9ZZZZ